MALNRTLVTILLPVYNGAEHLSQTLESLLNQTHSNFELLVVDDGSTDGSDQIVLNRQDARIKLVKNERNMGLIHTLNRGMSMARGRYIARMDADDIATQTRIECQLKYMVSHPGVGVCGTWSRTFGDVQESWETRYPTAHDDIVAHMIFNTALSHPTVMFDREEFPSDFVFYSSEAPHAEDYDLWVRASAITKLANIPEVLLDYRVHASQVSSKYAQTQKKTANMVRGDLLRRLNIAISEDELLFHEHVSGYAWTARPDFYRPAFSWLKKIAKEANSCDAGLLRAIRRATLDKALEMRAQLVRPDNRFRRGWMKATWPGMK